MTAFCTTPEGEPVSTEPTTPYAFVQWKGTDACLDIYCACGVPCHVDATFAYFVVCPGCEAVLEMAHYLEVRVVTDDQARYADVRERALKPELDDDE